MSKKNTTSTETSTPATEASAPVTEAAVENKPKRGRPVGSKNKTQKKLTEANLGYLVEKYGDDTIVPVSTQWLEEQARALIQAEIDAAAASAVSPTDAEDAATEDAGVKVEKTTL